MLHASQLASGFTMFFSLQGSHTTLFTVRDTDWVGGSEGKGLFALDRVLQGTTLYFEGWFSVSCEEDVEHMPAYCQSRVIYTRTRQSGNLLWYFAVNKTCYAGFANDPAGGEPRSANARLVFEYEQQLLLRPTLEITRDLVAGKLHKHASHGFLSFLTLLNQVKRFLCPMEKTTFSVETTRALPSL